MQYSPVFVFRGMRLAPLSATHRAILSRLPSGLICQPTSRAYIAHGRVQDVWQLSTILTVPACRLTVTVVGVGHNAAPVRQCHRRELVVIRPGIRGNVAIGRSHAGSHIGRYNPCLRFLRCSRISFAINTNTHPQTHSQIEIHTTGIQFIELWRTKPW